MPGKWSPAPCCLRMCGTIISIRKPTLSTCTSRACARRSIRVLRSPCCTRCAARDIWYVTALGKLFRTTTFKLTLVYLTVFALFAAFLLGYFALNTRRLITEQITETINNEITVLSEQYRVGGIRRLVVVSDIRARRPGSRLYLVTTFNGETLAGNVGSLAPGILDSPGWSETS